jgi:hypothetical protein
MAAYLLGERKSNRNVVNSVLADFRATAECDGTNAFCFGWAIPLAGRETATITMPKKMSPQQNRRSG